jgi:hypothetical protein
VHEKEPLEAISMSTYGLKVILRHKELNDIIMDNCGGQNKNNHVILLAPYLVEMGFFETANIIFLVTGHTKQKKTFAIRALII